MSRSVIYKDFECRGLVEAEFEKNGHKPYLQWTTIVHHGGNGEPIPIPFFEALQARLKAIGKSYANNGSFRNAVIGYVGILFQNHTNTDCAQIVRRKQLHKTHNDEMGQKSSNETVDRQKRIGEGKPNAADVAYEEKFLRAMQERQRTHQDFEIAILPHIEDMVDEHGEFNQACFESFSNDFIYHFSDSSNRPKVEGLSNYVQNKINQDFQIVEDGEIDEFFLLDDQETDLELNQNDSGQDDIQVGSKKRRKKFAFPKKVKSKKSVATHDAKGKKFNTPIYFTTNSQKSRDMMRRLSSKEFRNQCTCRRRISNLNAVL